MPPGHVPGLPHSAPFLLLDRVLQVDERSGAFEKLVTEADPCVAATAACRRGFVLEALAQGCGALVAALSGGEATPG